MIYPHTLDYGYNKPHNEVFNILILSPHKFRNAPRQGVGIYLCLNDPTITRFRGYNQ